MNLKRKKLCQSNDKQKVNKIKKSSVGLFALILITIGTFIMCYNYFVEKKDKLYEVMNLLLYDDETPKKIKKKEEQPNTDDEEDRTQSAEEEAKFDYQYVGVLEIPKINLRRGFVDINSKYNNVSRNITVIESSSYPDVRNGNLILAAHSGNCYVCFFNKLWKLSKGDVAYVDYNNIRYTYKIVDIYEVKKNGTVTIKRDPSKKTLTLITCTHNSDTMQTVYILELESPIEE